MIPWATFLGPLTHTQHHLPLLLPVPVWPEGAHHKPSFLFPSLRLGWDPLLEPLWILPLQELIIKSHNQIPWALLQPLGNEAACGLELLAAGLEELLDSWSPFHHQTPFHQQTPSGKISGLSVSPFESWTELIRVHSSPSAWASGWQWGSPSQAYGRWARRVQAGGLLGVGEEGGRMGGRLLSGWATGPEELFLAAETFVLVHMWQRPFPRELP